MPHVPILRNDFLSRASNKTFKLQLLELNMIDNINLDESSGDNLWRMWSNGYDVRLWSVQRGFDSPLSPSNEMKSISPSLLIKKGSSSLILTEIDKNIEFDRVGGLRLISPFAQLNKLNEFGSMKWRQ